MAEPVLHGLLQKAGRADREHGHRITPMGAGWLVEAPVKAPARWRKVALFYDREALVDFLAGTLTTPEDHL